MKSPFTGGKCELVRIPEKFKFRKENINIVHHSWRCVDTDEYFTTDELEQINITQVHNKYREKHNIPFPAEIKETRKKYGLPATKMSSVLGFGVNTYRNYEAGEIPEASNSKLIKLAANPAEFKRLIEISDTFSDKELKKLLKKIDILIEEEKDSDEKLIKKILSYSWETPNVFTGYRDLKLEKLGNMIVYFAQTLEPYKTKLNKLLFYSDFLSYKKTGFSISGCNYRAIELGPVPNGYDTLFEYLHRMNYYNIDHVVLKDRENIGKQFLPNPNNPFEQELFDESELACLKLVSDYFKSMKTDEVIEFSHQETGWSKKNNDKGLVEYDYAFELSIG